MVRDVVAMAELMEIASTGGYINSLKQRRKGFFAFRTYVRLSVQGWGKHNSTIRSKGTDQSPTWKPDGRRS